MDLHVVGPAATPGERAAVDAVLDPEIGPATGWTGGERQPGEGHVAHGGHAARARRDLLLPALEAIQAHEGWVSRGALNHVSRRLTVPPAEAYGVASFYALLSMTPRPPTVIHACDDLACRIAGAEDVCAGLEAALGPAGQPGRRRRHDVASKPVPRAVRAGARGARDAGGRGAGDPRRGPCHRVDRARCRRLGHRPHPTPTRIPAGSGPSSPRPATRDSASWPAAAPSTRPPSTPTAPPAATRP